MSTPRVCGDGGTCVDPASAYCLGVDNPHSCALYRGDSALADAVRARNAGLSPAPWQTRRARAKACESRSNPRPPDPSLGLSCGCHEIADCSAKLGDVAGGYVATWNWCAGHCPQTEAPAVSGEGPA